MIAHPAYGNFDWSQNLSFTGFYQQGYPDVRTPTSSGSSNTSLNDSRIDPKNSPKYREKRNKNNEAAKKSRATRKQRERDTMTENEKLKEKLARLELSSMELTNQLNMMKKTVENLVADREVLLARLNAYEQYPKPLAEINGNQQETTKYRILN